MNMGEWEAYEGACANVQGVRRAGPQLVVATFDSALTL